MSEAIVEGAVCKPNIAAGGRRMRRRFGYLAVVLLVAQLGLAIALHLPWFARLSVFPLATGAGFCFLQVSRNTCVARAREGTFEHDDLTKTAAPPDEVAASRRVAATIRRDAVLMGLGAALVAAATSVIV